MASFDFKSWCDGNGLKKATVDELEKNDLDSVEALQLVAAEDIATLELTLGQRKLLLQAVQGLSKTKNEEKEDNKIKSEDETTPVTTKTLAKDGGLEEILKKIEGISLDDPLYTLGATEQPSLSAPLGRLDQNPQVFLGSTAQQSSKKGGETKPLLIPDFVNNGAYDESFEEEQEIVGSLGARIVLRAPKAKPKLENVSLTMWVAANARIMHELSQTGKLASMGQIADYLSYTVKVAELLESHILNSVVLYDNEYRKLQHKFGFRWGSDSQHLHTRFLVKRRAIAQPKAKCSAKTRLGRMPAYALTLTANHNLSHLSVASLRVIV
ncbi:hypothetical protein QZH41_001658 [Actinostola sp. cb2023]|nr:hypothetical protein QZH41_001658 [Actinostola sp. cb2023]